ncbi:MT-A70-domain-containing protein [Xylariaceae sp. AK1471]|nr:MT-A70-domain-containing protein [Xylariaceae sp. AK1471]
MDSSVLFESSDNTVVVIDIPRSLEEAQVLPGQTITRHIISAKPVETPWQIPEPKKDTAKYLSPSAAVAELMILESVKAALETVRAGYDGPWCLPRVIHKQAKESEQNEPEEVNADANGIVNATESHKRKYKASSLASDEESQYTASPSPFLPEQSHHLPGTIESQREVFLQNAPQFDLVIIDPPWPSRSVKRKSDRYTTVYSIEEARDLLSQIPVALHLKRDGLVAVWVTNKAAIMDLLTAPGGTLAEWGLEPIGEWIWLKVTSTGEPVFDVESAWRKPWERLLIARKKGSSTSLPTGTKVIFGVPDIHSRKPNLRGLFENILPKGYLGLEIFARNLTAGWWSWGNEVLFFQQRHHWVAIENEPTGRL